MKFKRVAVVLAVLVALDLGLFLSGYRVLIRSRLVKAGEFFEAPMLGRGYADEPVLVCSYWTGRSVQKFVDKYSADGVKGSNRCRLTDQRPDGV